MLHPTIVQELRAIEHRLRADDRLPSPDKLQQYYAAFRDQFGPDRLKGMDGEALLVHMHGLSRDNRNTMVYWLEFKADEEFPFIFGSISGGSALKYGVYPSAETGHWMARGDGNKPLPISLDQAISIARRHRDQLIQGCNLLSELPDQADDDAYRRLQQRMNSLAPDIVNMAWAHKYFSLIYPGKLDNFHVSHYQRFHLVRLLLTPPSEGGRYVAAGGFVRAARELELPTNHLAILLNELSPHIYYHWLLRSGNTDGLSVKQAWQVMRDESCLALGWQALGDLSDITRTGADKKRLSERLKASGENDSKLRNEIFDFVTALDTFDLVALVVGDKVAGIARVSGPYYHEHGAKLPHRRPVNWRSLETWTSAEELGPGSILRRPLLYEVSVEIERRLLKVEESSGHGESISAASAVPNSPLTGIPGAIQSILERKGQVILYGPPGTGKTHWAEVAATELAARHAFGRRYEDLTDAERRQVFGAAGSLVRLCSFHPAYGYEDFLEGYRPAEVDGRMQFVLRDGVFKQLCNEAARHPDQRFYLIIDEINRGDIPRIFGELLTLLEKNKRGKTAVLPLSGQPFSVPENLYVIGTMNTADRLIALLDAALRRRFGFLELMPDMTVLAGAHVHGLPLAAWLRELNRRILGHVGRDARNLQIGHAYLLDKGKPVTDAAHFARIVREDIIPLLEEYCYEDYERLALILGSGLVDAAAQQIRSALFTPGSEPDLVRSLLEPTPDLATAAMAWGSASTGEEPEETDEPQEAEAAVGADGDVADSAVGSPAGEPA